MQFRVQYLVKSLILLVLLSSPQFVQGQVSKLYPIDEASKDSSFFVFRARLFDIIQKRNVSAFTEILHSNITSSFGGSGGIQEFKQTWNLNKPTSKLWNILNKTLALGGSFDNANTFSAPYSFSQFPDDLDAFEYGVIIGENVRVRQSVSLSSSIITELSYDIVKVPNWEAKLSNGQKWILITLKDGTKGYISEDYILSPIDYRAVFEKKNGKWQMTAFVAGD